MNAASNGDITAYKKNVYIPLQFPQVKMPDNENNYVKSASKGKTLGLKQSKSRGKVVLDSDNSSVNSDFSSKNYLNIDEGPMEKVPGNESIHNYDQKNDKSKLLNDFTSEKLQKTRTTDSK